MYAWLKMQRAGVNENVCLITYAGIKKEIVLLTEQLLAAIASGDYNAYK